MYVIHRDSMKSGRDIDATRDGQQLPSHGSARTCRSYSATTTAHDKAQSSNTVTTRAASSCSSCAAAAPMEVDPEPWIEKSGSMFLLALLHDLRLARLFWFFSLSRAFLAQSPSVRLLVPCRNFTNLRRYKISSTDALVLRRCKNNINSTGLRAARFRVSKIDTRLCGLLTKATLYHGYVHLLHIAY